MRPFFDLGQTLSLLLLAPTQRTESGGGCADTAPSYADLVSNDIPSTSRSRWNAVPQICWQTLRNAQLRHPAITVGHFGTLAKALIL